MEWHEACRIQIEQHSVRKYIPIIFRSTRHYTRNSLEYFYLLPRVHKIITFCVESNIQQLSAVYIDLHIDHVHVHA